LVDIKNRYIEMHGQQNIKKKNFRVTSYKFSASAEYLKTLSVARVTWFWCRRQVDRYRQGWESTWGNTCPSGTMTTTNPIVMLFQNLSRLTLYIQKLFIQNAIFNVREY